MATLWRGSFSQQHIQACDTWVALNIFAHIPICSMYRISTYIRIWTIYRANVGKYSIHGAFGIDNMSRFFTFFFNTIPSIITANKGTHRKTMKNLVNCVVLRGGHSIRMVMGLLDMTHENDLTCQKTRAHNLPIVR